MSRSNGNPSSEWFIKIHREVYDELGAITLTIPVFVPPPSGYDIKVRDSGNSVISHVRDDLDKLTSHQSVYTTVDIDLNDSLSYPLTIRWEAP